MLRTMDVMLARRSGLIHSSLLERVWCDPLTKRNTLLLSCDKVSPHCSIAKVTNAICAIDCPPRDFVRISLADLFFGCFSCCGHVLVLVLVLVVSPR